MSAIIIKGDEKSNKILKELAKQLGADVVSLKDNQYEDFLLGTIIDSEKTGKDATRDEVFQKLKKK
jgi:N-acetylglucosamine kinase-like BadF-type ATPase